MSTSASRIGVIAIWVAFIGGFTYIFSWLLDKQHNPNQSNLTQVSQSGESEVVLARNRSGHYLAAGTINQYPVVFLLDTGATHVSIPLALANQIGLEKGQTATAHTANGTVQVYSTRLETVSLGHITLSNVSASINPGFSGNEILLGMSFLRHLELLQTGDTLRLRVPSR